MQVGVAFLCGLLSAGILAFYLYVVGKMKPSPAKRILDDRVYFFIVPLSLTAYFQFELLEHMGIAEGGSKGISFGTFGVTLVVVLLVEVFHGTKKPKDKRRNQKR